MTVIYQQNATLLQKIFSDPHAIRLPLYHMLMKNISSLVSISTDLGKCNCHDAAAFMHFLNKPYIKGVDEYALQYNSSKEWIDYFYTQHSIWDGVSDIPAGKVIGFHNPQNISSHNGVFHSAFSIGGTKVRAVNSLTLGNGWKTADLTQSIQLNADGSMAYNGAPVVVYISDR
ncbi:hypothetical protein [Acinetobacter sp.]|jgi:hypothetical protein|uniref:hypothetical protein n=1 Tax=Acinetobacter sp. TaxID=472 RepID=UPI0035B1F334